MAILSNFEVTVLTPKQHVVNGILTTKWEPINEHKAPSIEVSQRDRNDLCQRYIGVASSAESPPNKSYSEFAIDFKVHCGFTLEDTEAVQTEFLVFRVYLDGEKIGSAHVKRARWERSGTYRVRKKSRRFWAEEAGSWIESMWAFEEGSHGTLKVEVWRQRERLASSGSWDHPDWFSDARWTFMSDFCGETAKEPTVRHTEKIGTAPLATFVFEYRSYETLSLLGMQTGKQPDPATTTSLNLTDTEIGLDDSDSALPLEYTGEIASIPVEDARTERMRLRIEAIAAQQIRQQSQAQQTLESQQAQREINQQVLHLPHITESLLEETATTSFEQQNFGTNTAQLSTGPPYLYEQSMQLNAFAQQNPLEYFETAQGMQQLQQEQYQQMQMAQTQRWAQSQISFVKSPITIASSSTELSNGQEYFMEQYTLLHDDSNILPLVANVGTQEVAVEKPSYTQSGIEIVDLTMLD